MAMAEDEAENASSREVSDVVHESDNESEVATDNHEPVYVIIDGNEVDIGGTDIDPEFINALPEDMRAEVLAQHISERRAEAQQQNINSREINDEFLIQCQPIFVKKLLLAKMLPEDFPTFYPIEELMNLTVI